MNVSKKGLEFIQDVEGCKLFAYKDGGGVWTIGVGHTGPEVVKGLTCTMEQALQWLSEDTEEAVAAVEALVKVKLTQNQFDALVSFVFNLGSGSFAKSTLLRKLNAGDYEGASREFPRWNKDNDPKTGKLIEVEGLTKRRLLEQSMFNTKD